MEKIKNLKQGFTLLELLVVVLIIGILAGIALPQYQKSVEKAKLSEALLNFQTLKNAMDRYMLQHVCPGTDIYCPDDIQLDIELSGGEWNDHKYVTNNFSYFPSCASTSYSISIYSTHEQQEDLPDYVLIYESDGPNQICATNGTDMGKYICKYLESQGWEYNEGEY